MRYTNLSFPPDYLYGKEDELFRSITKDYMFKCDNYSVAYNLIRFLDNMELCEHSDMTDDVFYPYSFIIFITCRPKDVDRIKCIAKCIPSSIKANVKIYDENEEEV